MHLRILLFFFLLWAGHANAGLTEAKKVLNRLIIVIGNTSLPKPRLDIDISENLIAVTSTNGDILIGRKVLSNCARFGADSTNALACLLSHELVHYYYRHFWAFEFGSAYASSDWGKKISDLDTNTKLREMNETQADQLGFYFAFGAGYKTWHLAEQFLDSTYRWYGLNDTLKGYPNLKQRKAMAKESAAKFAKLIPVFEMSNYFRVLSSVYLGEQQSVLLDFSILGYEHMFTKDLRSIEMYNNIAVAKILKAQKYGDQMYARLKLPLIVEQSSMMYEAARTRGYGEEDETKFKALMKEAMESLDMALNLDANYWPATVNKAVALIGLKQYGYCNDMIDLASKSNLNKDIAKTAVISEIKGICLASKGDSMAAIPLFKIAIKSASTTAVYNQSIMCKKTIVAKEDENNDRDTSEKWNNKIVQYALNAYHISRVNNVIYSNEKSILFIDSFAGYTIFEFKSNLYQCAIESVKVAVCNDAQAKTSLGIQKGSSSKEVITKYGQANSSILGSVYYYWIYPKKNMVILIDNASKQVSGWYYFVAN